MRTLFSLNPYFWKYKYYLIAGAIFVIASAWFGIYPAQILREAMNMVEEALKKRSTLGGDAQKAMNVEILATLLKFGGIMLGLALIRGLFTFFNRQTLIVMSRHIEYDMRNDLYNHFQSLPLEFYRRNRTGDLMARMTEDVNRVRMYIGPAVMYTLNTLIVSVMVVATMLSISPKLTLFSLAPLPILSWAIYWVQSRIEKQSRRVQEQMGKMNTFVQEMFSGIRVLKAYTKEEETERKFGIETEAYKEESLKLARIDSLFSPVVLFLVGLSGVFTVWIGGELVIDKKLSLGEIAEFIIYINMLAFPIISLGWVTTLVQQAAASQSRLNELMAQRSEIIFGTRKEAFQKADIQFENVSFRYPDTDIVGLDKVSFHLKAGQKLGIIGAAGSGKSTLCQLLVRMYDASSGSIRIDATPIQEFSKDALRGNMGYTPQDVFLFSDTIARNIAFGKPDATQAEIEKAAKDAFVYDNIVAFPDGFDTVVGERGVMLSGGQKQRISIARALIRKPQFLILDDVLSAVDTQTEEHILQNIRQYCQENPHSSVVQVAHRISCIQDADWILVMKNGAISEQGTHQSLLDEGGYYARIYEKQLLEEELA